MCGNKRRGTGRIDGYAGPPQIQTVGNTIRRNTHHSARRGMGTNGTVIVWARLDLGVISCRYPNEDPRIGSCQLFDDLAPVLKRLPGHFEQETLLRIDVGRFTRRYAEAFRLKMVYTFGESAPP
jgi:hypothetical protein